MKLVVSSVWFIILLVISNSKYSTIEAVKKRTNMLWTSKEKIELMKIWNRIYQGKGRGDYSNLLFEEWEKLHGRVKWRSISSLVHEANRLLERGFTIPAEHNDEKAIRLNMIVKKERDRAATMNESISLKSHKSISLSQNHTDYHQTHFNSANDLEYGPQKRVRKGKELMYIPWSDVEEMNLMRAWNEVYEYRRCPDYAKRLVQVWKRLTPGAAKRTSASIIQKAISLVREGFTIPAIFNNGVELKIDRKFQRERSLEKHEELQKIQKLDTNYPKGSHEEAKNRLQINRHADSRLYHKIGTSSHDDPTHRWNDLELRLGNHPGDTSDVTFRPHNHDYRPDYLPISTVPPSSRGENSLKNNSEHNGPWLFLNSANDPFFKDIYHPDTSASSTSPTYHV